MKKLLYTALAFLLACLCLSGCSEKIDWGSTVYSAKSLAGNCAYSYFSDLKCVYFSEPGHVYRACIDPVCMHQYPECEAAAENIVLSVLVAQPDGRKLPLIYTTGLRRQYITENGEEKDLDESERHKTVVKVFDAETGKSRNIAYVDLYYADKSLLFAGRLYMSTGDGHVGSVDVETGECAYLESDMHLTIIGIWGGRLYMMNKMGVVMSCKDDLSDIREVYDCGIGAVGSSPICAFVDSGMLYFERNVKRIPGEYFVGYYSDVYAVRLDGKSGSASETLVAENVMEYKPCEGELYYNIYEYREYESVTVDGAYVTPHSYDGGTLYCYDAATGESSVCFSDIGISITELTDIADGRILFEGWRYRDIEQCVNGECHEQVCIADIDSGEWHVMAHVWVEIEN